MYEVCYYIVYNNYLCGNILVNTKEMKVLKKKVKISSHKASICPQHEVNKCM